MEKEPKSPSGVKRKHKSNSKLEIKEPKVKKLKTPAPEVSTEEKIQETPKATTQTAQPGALPEDVVSKYPILNDKELIDKFMKVPLNNNQKGRIRHAIQLKNAGAAPEILPDVIHSQIQGLLRSSENITDSVLRRIRILYNMLKTALTIGKVGDGEIKNKRKRKYNKASKKNKSDGKDINSDGKDIYSDGKDIESDGKEKEADGKQVKKKGPKRYVVFLGSLPLDIDKEKIMKHFIDINEHIVDVRIPKLKEGKKSAIAYLELSNEPSYELALSKHHTMLGTKRINVLYSVQKNSKMSSAEVKSKSAKLIALQKSGKLIGSVPLAKKRSQRRMKMKKTNAKQEEN